MNTDLFLVAIGNFISAAIAGALIRAVTGLWTRRFLYFGSWLLFAISILGILRAIGVIYPKPPATLEETIYVSALTLLLPVGLVWIVAHLKVK